MARVRSRMFSPDITESDNFFELPVTTQCLYFHLCLYADDDGFIDNLKSIFKQLDFAKEADFKTLLDNGYLFYFSTGILAVAHWKVHNYIRKDRYKPTVHIYESSMLSIDPKTKFYFVKDESNFYWDTNGIPTVSVRKEKISKEKLSEDNCVYIESHTYFENETLNDTFSDFISMRETMGRPMMDSSIKLMIKKLSDLSQQDETKMVMILQQAILRGTPDIYPLDEDLKKKKQQAPNKFKNFNEREEVDYDALQKELEQ